MFKPGDKVFAKMKGFPFWPARVDTVPEHVEVPKGKLPVFFYGTHQVSFLPTKSLVSFEINRELHGKRKNLAKAMEEIDSDPDILLLGKDPAAEAFWESLYPHSSGSIMRKSESKASSRSSSPAHKKVSKRKPSKAARLRSSKRRRSGSKDELNSLSSLSDIEDTQHISALNAAAQETGLFTNTGGVCDGMSKIHNAKRHQNIKESRSKRPRDSSNVSDIGVEIDETLEDADMIAESGNFSSLGSVGEEFHVKASSDVEITPVETMYQEQSVEFDCNHLYETRASGFPSFPLMDEADSLVGGSGFALMDAEDSIESITKGAQILGGLSDSDGKSVEDKSERVHLDYGNEHLLQNLVPSGNDHTRDSGVSLKKSVDSYPDFGNDFPADTKPAGFREPGNSETVMNADDRKSSSSIESEAYRVKSEVLIRETSTLSALDSFCSKGLESDKQEMEVDDLLLNKSEDIKHRKHIRKRLDGDSDSSKSSVKSGGAEVVTTLQSKGSRKISHRHRVKTVDNEPESKDSVRKKVNQRSGTPPDTVQFLHDLVVKLKSSLLRGRENFTAAVDVLECVCATEVSLLQLAQVWELTDCVKKCKKYRLSEEVRSAASKTMAYFQKIQKEASKEEIAKVRAILDELNRTQHQPSKTPEPPVDESTAKQVSAVTTGASIVAQFSPVVNFSSDQPSLTGKNKFSLEALRAELDEKANSLLARLAATEARLRADRSKIATTSNNTTPLIPSTSSSMPRRKVEEAANAALSRVDEVASRLTVDLDVVDSVPPPPPPPPLPVQARLGSRPHQQQQQQVDLDTRISQLMMGVITPATSQARHRESSSSSDQPSAKLLALREQIQRKRKAVAAVSLKKHEKGNESSKNKSADDVIYDLLGV